MSWSDQYGVTHRRAAGRNAQNCPGRQFVNAAIDRVGGRHVAEAQVRQERVAIELRRPAPVGAQRLELGAEQQPSVELGPVERLDAEAVAHEIKRPFAPVPKRHREHADQTFDGRFDTPDRGPLDNHLGVAMPAEPPSGRFEFRAQFVGVVDFAVVGNDKAAA